MPSNSSLTSQINNIFDDDDEDGWQDMPIVREDEFASGLDEEDQKKYHYTPSAKGARAANATGNLIDLDGFGSEWRTKVDQNENDYTRLRINEEENADEVHLRTKYLFDEEKAMTPLSQMQATKNLLTEAQRIAYVGLCSLTSREMSQRLKVVQRKELKYAVQDMELWAMKIMGRLYYHMELETQEQRMIESLAQHGVEAMDLVPSLMTTHTVANPEYDPVEARKQAHAKKEVVVDVVDSDDSEDDTSQVVAVRSNPSSPNPSLSTPVSAGRSPNTATQAQFQTTSKVLQETSTLAMPGVTTSLSAVDENVTLDIRWTVLCDLFLILIADSVYDARSRVLLENVALKLGLGWLDVVKFESRVTEALEIQEDVEKMEHQELIDGRQKKARKKRYMMMGLATLGGGLVIGLSAGLLAPVIGAGLGAAFTTIGITGTTGFLAGAGGAAVITTGGVLTGSGIAVKGMAKRTQQVRTFDVLPLHNNKRVNCILTVPGFMNGAQDDVRLPFSVLDPIVGDVFSVLWEPEMIRETGSALKILTGEVLSQIGQTVLQATVMTALMSALQWPIILTKLGYLIDNPWNNALDRARAAGSVLADVLTQRHLGVRPITLIGFSLGARVIFYALLELAKNKAYGIVQDVFLLGATLTASTKAWSDSRSVVSGRFVNAYAKNDWVLNYLFRATSGGVGTVAGLRPIEGVPGLENVDVTDKIAGHMSYRALMPLILDQLGFPVSADYFDEPVEPDFKEDRIVVREEDGTPNKKRWFSRKKAPGTPQQVSRPPSAASQYKPRKSDVSAVDDALPARVEVNHDASPSSPKTPSKQAPSDFEGSNAKIPLHAGFDFDAIKDVIGKAELNHEDLHIPPSNPFSTPPIPPPSKRSASAPPFLDDDDEKDDDTATPVEEEYPSNGESSNTISRSDLGPSFVRSMSLSDVHEDEVASASSSRPTFGVPPSAAPTFTFGANDGTPWASTSDPYGPSAPGATPTFSFGKQFNSFSSASPFAHAPPTQLRSTEPPPLSTGLSFAGADGSITLSAGPDPWRIPSEKKTAVHNPWS